MSNIFRQLLFLKCIAPAVIFVLIYFRLILPNIWCHGDWLERFRFDGVRWVSCSFIVHLMQAPYYYHYNLISNRVDPYILIPSSLSIFGQLFGKFTTFFSLTSNYLYYKATSCRLYQLAQLPHGTTLCLVAPNIQYRAIVLDFHPISPNIT